MKTRQTLVRIKRIDEDKQIVFGEVYAPYKLDTYGEFMFPEDIETMAHRFMRLDLDAVIDTNHNEQPNGSYPVESFIARDGDTDYTPGAWVLGVKIEDGDIWAKVKRGEINGFSFQSLVRAVDMEVEVTIFRDAVGVTEPAEDGHDHVWFVQFDESGNVMGGWTSTDKGHSHAIKHGTVTEAADGHAHRFFAVGE